MNNLNKTLHKAKKGKNDEFYTQYVDIERELNHYKDQLKNKIVYCNTDDENSNFLKFLIDNFNTLKLKKIIATSINKTYKLEYTNTLIKTPLKENGDFNSIECVNILKKCDIVITNPPFSLFREYISLLMLHNKQFLIISNINALTYKEVFNYIKNDKIWMGINMGRGISGFIVPEHYELYGTETKIDNNTKIISSNNCMWLTNLNHNQRNDFIALTKTYNNSYQKYDNYNAINVNKTKDIPKDYNGYMGVPITFLHKYNPNQFEIIKFRKGDDDKDLCINGKYPYFRIIIKRK